MEEQERAIEVDPNDIIDTLMSAYQQVLSENASLRLKVTLLEASVRSLTKVKDVAE